MTKLIYISTRGNKSFPNTFTSICYRIPYFKVVWGFDLRASSLQGRILPLELFHQLLELGIFEIWSHELFALAGFKPPFS
jgi:hypothetical protein